MAEANTSEEKTPNYTDEMVQTAIQMYSDLGNDGLDEIAEAIGKNVRSVRSKFSGKVSMWQLPSKPRRKWTVLLKRNYSGILKPLVLMSQGSKEPLSQR